MLKDEADVFGIISCRLSAIGFPNLTKEKLEEETKAKLGDSNDLYTIVKFIGETYDVKFIMYNGDKLPCCVSKLFVMSDVYSNIRNLLQRK